MKNVFNHFKLVLIYIIASLISYLIIMLSNLLNIYDLVNTNAELFDFGINLSVITIFFMFFGLCSREKNTIQIIVMFVVNISLFILLLAFDGSFINLLLIPLDSVLIYANDFIYSISKNEHTSIVIAMLLSCFYPPIIFLIFKSLKKLKKYNKSGAYSKHLNEFYK